MIEPVRFRIIIVIVIAIVVIVIIIISNAIDAIHVSDIFTCLCRLETVLV